MIIFYDGTGEIRELSTWTLLNPDTYVDDGAMLIDGVGLRPLHPEGYRAVAFDSSFDIPHGALAEEIRQDLIAGDAKCVIDTKTGRIQATGDVLQRTAARAKLANDAELMAAVGVVDKRSMTEIVR